MCVVGNSVLNMTFISCNLIGIDNGPQPEEAQRTWSVSHDVFDIKKLVVEWFLSGERDKRTDMISSWVYWSDTEAQNYVVDYPVPWFDVHVDVAFELDREDRRAKRTRNAVGNIFEVAEPNVVRVTWLWFGSWISSSWTTEQEHRQFIYVSWSYPDFSKKFH
jgi:hypothetical protein